MVGTLLKAKYLTFLSLDFFNGDAEIIISVSWRLV
jgi:hypothetical protein